MFDQLDMNKDGVLDAGEILELTSGVKDKKTRKEAEDLVDMIDDNNDGKVEKEEWKTIFGILFEKVKAAMTKKGKDAVLGDTKSVVAPTAPKAGEVKQADVETPAPAAKKAPTPAQKAPAAAGSKPSTPAPTPKALAPA